MEKEKNITTTPWKLPRELIEDILLRLPVKSLLRFRCVCKSWQALISNPTFIKTHLRRPLMRNSLSVIFPSDSKIKSIELQGCDEAVDLYLSFDLNPTFQLVGSCNGIVCYSNQNITYLWNPASRNCMALPGISNDASLQLIKMRLGFGHCPTTEEYKVVRLGYSMKQQSKTHYIFEVHVYTLGTESWRGIGELKYLVCSPSPATLFNGALHWIASPITGPRGSTKLLISFDLQYEIFQERLLPCFENKQIALRTLMWDGHVSVFCHFYFKQYFEIWVMKDYGNDKSWVKIFSGSHPELHLNSQSLQPLGFLKNGEILLQMNESWLASYDPVNQRFKDLHISCRPSSTFEACLYVESLVPLGATMPSFTVTVEFPLLHLSLRT